MQEEFCIHKSPYQELKPPKQIFKVPNGMTPAQIQYWKALRDKGEFVNAVSFRAQLGIAVEELCVRADSSEGVRLCKLLY